MTSPPARYVRLSSRRERQVICPAGHAFTPDVTVRGGSGDVVCRYRTPPGNQLCGRRLLIIPVPGLDQRLIVEVSPEDIRFLEECCGEDVLAEVVYLLTTPLHDR